MNEILLGSKGKVDFNKPLEMSEQEYKDFIELLGQLFDEEVIQEEPMNNLRKDRLGDKHFSREWTTLEYRLLYNTENTQKVAEKLGRSWMSVDMRRGQFLPDFTTWAQDNDYDLARDDIESLVDEYIEQKEIKKKERKRMRKAIRENKKAIEGEKKQINRIKEKLERKPTEKIRKQGEKAIEDREQSIQKLKQKNGQLEEELDKLRQ